MTSHFSLLARVALVAALSLVSASLSAAEPAADASRNESIPCQWQQVGPCVGDARAVELPSDAPRAGTVIAVDVAANSIYLFDDGKLVAQSLAATGTDKVLKKGDRIWLFRTPRGRHTVLRKITDPIWTKPDWAFVEAGKTVPPRDSPLRQEKGKLGRYALDLGDGILIHGTDDPTSFGRKASHGCIRVPHKMLSRLYASAKVGTPVYIYDGARTAREIHSDLDYPGTRLVLGEKE